MTMTTISDQVRHSLRERTPGMGLTREFYTDADIFALDLEHIFYKDWLFVAHSAELPEAGSYLTLQIGAYPILLTRAADGDHPRLHQLLPASRGARLSGSGRQGSQARLSLSPVDLSSRWTTVRRPTHGAGLRSFAARAESAVLRSGRRVHLRLPRGRGPGFRPHAAASRALSAAAWSLRGARGVSVDHHRGR